MRECGIFQSGYNLREVLESIDRLQFRTQQQKHELSDLYETRIKNRGNAGRNGDEYYTPRPLIRAMIQVIKPQLGETIYDGACGSAGFLCEAYEYLRHSKADLSTKELETLQTRTFFGKEKKALAYIIGVMNMILHGIEAPNIIQTNTLAEALQAIQEKNRYHIRLYLKCRMNAPARFFDKILTTLLLEIPCSTRQLMINRLRNC